MEPEIRIVELRADRQDRDYRQPGGQHHRIRKQLLTGAAEHSYKAPPNLAAWHP